MTQPPGPRLVRPRANPTETRILFVFAVGFSIGFFFVAAGGFGKEWTPELIISNCIRHLLQWPLSLDGWLLVALFGGFAVSSYLLGQRQPKPGYYCCKCDTYLGSDDSFESRCFHCGSTSITKITKDWHPFKR